MWHAYIARVPGRKPMCSTLALAIHESTTWPWPLLQSPPLGPGKSLLLSSSSWTQQQSCPRPLFLSSLLSVLKPHIHLFIKFTWFYQWRSFRVFPLPPTSLLWTFPQSIPCPHCLSSGLSHWGPKSSLCLTSVCSPICLPNTHPIISISKILQLSIYLFK